MLRKKVPERREKLRPRDHGLFRMYELNISCPNIWGRFQVGWLFSSLTEKSSSAAILEFPFYVRWPGRALPTNLTCDVTSRLVDEDWERGFLEKGMMLFNGLTCKQTWTQSWLSGVYFYTFWCSLRENTLSFVWNGDQQCEDTFISAKKRTFAPKSDSITIFAF